MKGTKYLSDLITDPSAIHPGRINIIEAPTSGGKTWFALNTLPTWAGSPEKVLYLIDTVNGELRLQQNILTVSRRVYALSDYLSGRQWGEYADAAGGKMPVMTYAGFGSEIKKSGHPFWEQFSYIVCDEMQNLARYQAYENDNDNLVRADMALRRIAEEGKICVVVLSATPEKVRQHFGPLCRDTPYEKDELIRFETEEIIPYTSLGPVLLRHAHERGILYIQSVEQMKKWIAFARENGIRADGFWSTNPRRLAVDPMTQAQLRLRESVLRDERMPDDLDLLVLNDASETCIKIRGDPHKVDYIIVHRDEEEKRIQIRGRYHGDLKRLYVHSPSGDAPVSVPEKYLNRPLFREEKKELCQLLGLRANGKLLGWTGTKERIEQSGYRVTPGRKNNRRFNTIEKCTTKERNVLNGKN